MLMQSFVHDGKSGHHEIDEIEKVENRRTDHEIKSSGQNGEWNSRKCRRDRPA
jgi:hypothetical protein